MTLRKTSKGNDSKTSGLSGVPIYEAGKLNNNMNFTGFDKKDKRHSDQVTLLGHPPQQD